MCYTTLAFIKVLFVPLVQWIEQGPPKECPDKITNPIKPLYYRHFCDYNKSLKYKSEPKSVKSYQITFLAVYCI